MHTPTARRGARAALGAGGALVVVLVAAQVALPAIAAKRVRDRVARYGSVRGVSVSAWPAVELLWGAAGSVDVRAGTLTIAPAQVAALLWEARGVHNMTVSATAVTLRVPALPHGLTVTDVRMQRRGGAVDATATLTQAALDAALPSGFRIEPTTSGGGQIEARASGALFGVSASIDAVVRPLEGRLVTEPRGLPFAGLAKVTLFENPHLKVSSVGLRVVGERPPIYRLSFWASLR